MNPSAEFIVLTADLIVLKNFSSTIFGISGLELSGLELSGLELSGLELSGL
jgi:hypothetical protein